MNVAFDRFAAGTGIAVALAAASWWLGSARLALDSGRDAAQGAADALQALWYLRAAIGAIVAVRVGALADWRHGTMAASSTMAPAWPMVLLAWSASAVAPMQLVIAECVLLAGAALLALAGSALRRLLRRTELAVPAATGVGAMMAAAVWVVRSTMGMP